MNFRTASCLLAGSVLFLVSANARAQAPRRSSSRRRRPRPTPALRESPANPAPPPVPVPPAEAHAGAVPAAPPAPANPLRRQRRRPPPRIRRVRAAAGLSVRQLSVSVSLPVSVSLSFGPTVSVGLSAAGSAPTRSPTAEAHDGGYIRLQLGVNWTGLTGKAGGDTVTYNGSGASLAAAFGYSITPHLILYGEFFIAGATRCHREDERHLDQHRPILARHRRARVSELGAAYYFGPNLFAAATMLDAQIDVTDCERRHPAEESERPRSRAALRQGVVGVGQLGPRRQRAVHLRFDEGQGRRSGSQSGADLARNVIVAVVFGDLQLARCAQSAERNPRKTDLHVIDDTLCARVPCSVGNRQFF